MKQREKENKMLISQRTVSPKMKDIARQKKVFAKRPRVEKFNRGFKFEYRLSFLARGFSSSPICLIDKKHSEYK